VPSAQAHLPDDGGGLLGSGGEGRGEDRPVLLEGIDRALEESGRVGDTQRAASIRVWRDELSRALGALNYAESILRDDVAILRHRLATGAPSSKEIIDDLPGVLADPPSGTPASAPEAPGADVEADPGLFARSDALLAVHAEMAGVDLTSSDDVERVLALVEQQVTALATRRQAVETRLAEIRTAIITEYKQGAHPTETGPH
jgi:hypothetical protein